MDWQAFSRLNVHSTYLLCVVIGWSNVRLHPFQRSFSSASHVVEASNSLQEVLFEI